MKNIFSGLFLILFLLSVNSELSNASEKKKEAPAQVVAEFDHSHEKWSNILKQYVVVQGPVSKVRYKALSKNSKELNGYLDEVHKLKKADFDAFTREQKMAYLINAYNAYTIKLIADNYPVKSIKKIGPMLSTPWKMKFFRLFGKDTSLDDIENDMLRKEFKDPRVHFAINCASIGCPALRAEAYTAEKLNSQLDDQLHLFLQDPSRNSYDLREKKLVLSKIFDWFHEDFEQNGSTVKKFVSTHLTEDKNVIHAIESDETSISYSDYDWDLNEAK